MQFIPLALLSLAAGTTYAAPTSHSNSALATLEERDLAPAGQILCGRQFGLEPYSENVQSLIDSIFERGQVCAPANECEPATYGTRSSVNTRSGKHELLITLCNTNPYPKCVNAADVKVRAQETLDHCVAEVANWSVLGQGFYPDGTNVLIKVRK